MLIPFSTKLKYVMSKRELIFKAALPLFDEFGFAGTTTAKIAKEAGIGAGTLFLYFETKDDLIIELYFEIKGEMIALFEKHLDGDNYSKELLEKIWDELIYWGITNQEKYSFIHQFSYSTYFRDLAKKRSSIGFNHLEDCFRALLKEEKHIILAMTSFFGQNSAHIYNILYYDQNARSVIEADSFDLFWNGISHLLK